MKKQEPVVLAFGEEMYNALKEASKQISKRMHYANDSITFDDAEMKLIIEPTHEWYLIQLGYDACKILNNITETI
jgi:hypothetical protein